jgi:hypothetical protein
MSADEGHLHTRFHSCRGGSAALGYSLNSSAKWNHYWEESALAFACLETEVALRKILAYQPSSETLRAVADDLAERQAADARFAQWVAGLRSRGEAARAAAVV